MMQQFPCRADITDIFRLLLRPRLNLHAYPDHRCENNIFNRPAWMQMWLSEFLFRPFSSRYPLRHCLKPKHPQQLLSKTATPFFAQLKPEWSPTSQAIDWFSKRQLFSFIPAPTVPSHSPRPKQINVATDQKSFDGPAYSTSLLS